MSNYDDPRAMPVRTNVLGEGRSKPSDESTIQLVVPKVERVAEGEHVKVTTVNDIRAVAALPVAGAVVVQDERLLRLALDNDDLIGVRFVKLTDYPGADYTPEFERLTWDLPTVSYNELLADVAAEKRRTIAVGAQAGARQKAPRRDQTLDRDRTKHFGDFTRAQGLTGESAEEDDHGDVDPAP